MSRTMKSLMFYLTCKLTCHSLHVTLETETKNLFTHISNGQKNQHLHHSLSSNSHRVTQRRPSKAIHSVSFVTEEEP